LHAEINSHDPSPHVVGLSETFLCSTDSSSLLSFDIYDVFRCDRSDRIGGGVALLVQKQFRAFERTDISKHEQSEILTVRINGTRLLHVCVVYRPPHGCGKPTDEIHLKNLLKDLSEVIAKVDGDLIFLGDLNFPYINWNTYESTDAHSKLFLNFLLENHLTQFVHDSTFVPSGNILDLVISNNPYLIESLSVQDQLADTCDHNMITFKTPYNSNSKPSKRYNFAKADWVGIKFFISCLKWPDLFNTCVTANDFWCIFLQIVEQVYRSHIPLVCTNIARAGRSDIPLDIVKKIRQKKALWKKFCRSGREIFKHQHRILANEIKRDIRRFNCSKEEKILNSGNVKKFYSFVRSKLVHRPSVPALISNGRLITESSDKANILNSFFGSVFTHDDGVLPQFPVRTTGRLFDIDITEDLVVAALNKIRIDGAPGPDNIAAAFLKTLASELAEPLRTIFEVSFRRNEIPTDWLSANVTAVYKRKGKPACVDNYRPISLTCIIAKSMERIVSDQIMKFLASQGLLSVHQHGFRSSHSTLTQLLECLQDWCLAVSRNKPVDVAYLDLAKAFDSVSHAKLIHKLKSYGIRGSLLMWIESFLSNRQQRVIVENSKSNPIQVISGVPQGTILGPLLFIIYINDVVDVVQFSKVKLYADDSKVYSQIESDIDSARLQEDLDSIAFWANKWQLKLSIAKCSILHINSNVMPHEYSLENQILPSCTSQKDLGVTISHDLKSREHCSTICNKAMTTSCLIFRCFVNRSVGFMCKLFCTYVRPTLEYCSPAWSPQIIGDIDKIENVQRRFTKRISGLANKSYLERLRILKLESLEIRRIKADLVQTFKIIKGIELNVNDFFVFKTHSHATRSMSLNSFQIQPINTRSHLLYNSFSFRVVNLWNNLDEITVRSTSVSAFRQKINNLDFSDFTQGRAHRV
jgi:hypothetical protein